MGKNATNVPVMSGKRTRDSSTQATGQAGAPATQTTPETGAVTQRDRESNRDRAAQQDYVPQYASPPRKPADKRPAAFNPLAWVLDGATGLLEEVQHNDLGLSEEFWIHLQATRREGLLTARALIDSLLAHLDKEADKEAERTERRERRGGVEVEF